MDGIPIPGKDVKGNDYGFGSDEASVVGAELKFRVLDDPQNQLQ